MNFYTGHKQRLFACSNKSFLSRMTLLMLILAMVIMHTCIFLGRDVANKLIKLRSDDNNIPLQPSRNISEIETEGNNKPVHHPSILPVLNVDAENVPSPGPTHEWKNDSQTNGQSMLPLPKLKSNDLNLQQPTIGSYQIYDFQTTFARNAERKKHLQQQCSTFSRKENRRNSFTKQKLQILTSPLVSVAYCRVHKAASWYTIHTLGQILNCTEDCLRTFSSRIRMLTYELKKEALRKAFKFMFVREPYIRLFSTYCNKFYFPKGNWDPIGKDIVKRYRKNPSEDSLKYGHDVTFAELIHYTIEEFEAGNKMDAHIRPMHTNCHPCDYDYDFIGKLETMKSDWKYLEQEWKSRNITTNVPSDIGEKPKYLLGDMQYLLLTLKKVENSNITQYDLFRRAWNYYQITSVISKRFGMPFSKFSNKPYGYYSFLYQLTRASIHSKLHATEMEAQRQEALLQAYSTVPLEDLYRLKKVVKEDCLLFGYDESPEWLFGRKIMYNKSASFDYFSGMTADRTIE